MPVAKSLVPRRSFGSVYNNEHLPASVPIVGLGCSSFSTFFWSKEEQASVSVGDWSAESLDVNHPCVQEWIRTIVYAVTVAGITVLDSAPWYGHGTSEVVIGWALNDATFQHVLRPELTINTKIGRYEANPAQQFDFSETATLESVQRSLRRMRCGGYVDVLQLHDPEFAPTLDILFQETIPAMLKCQTRGWCRAIGMTGYPLEVQHLILERSLEEYGRNIWDQSLSYGHYNLHDTSLLHVPVIAPGSTSFADFCADHKMMVLAAAPLSMGLLTAKGPPEWHPASTELKQACREAAELCVTNGVDISNLALLWALSNPRIPCTILGMSRVDEVAKVHTVAMRFHAVEKNLTPDEVLEKVLSEQEKKVLKMLRDPTNGPFASVWQSGLFQWDGVKEAHIFWKHFPDHAFVKWQTTEGT